MIDPTTSSLLYSCLTVRPLTGLMSDTEGVEACTSLSVCAAVGGVC